MHVHTARAMDAVARWRCMQSCLARLVSSAAHLQVLKDHPECQHAVPLDLPVLGEQQQA